MAEKRKVRVKRVKKHEYLFLSSYLRAREKYLLTHDDLERMATADSVNEAARVLTDCGYGELEPYSSVLLEERIGARRAEILSDIVRMAPNKAIADIFRIKYDYHNAKVLVKSEHQDSEAALRLLSDAGRVPAEEIVAAFRNDRLDTLPEPLGPAMGEAKAVLARTSDPQLSDFVLDKAYFDEFFSVARAFGSKFLLGYARLTIDSSNLRSVVRAKRLGKGADFIKEILAEGGNVSPKKLLDAVKLPMPLSSAYAKTELADAAKLADECVKGGRMTELERLCDNALVRYLTKAKKVAFGEETPISYICALEGELSQVRIIMAGHAAGMKRELIRERLRDTYV